MRRKIGFIVSSFDVGGAERQYDYLIRYLDRELFEVHVIQLSHRGSRPQPVVYPISKVVTFEMRHRVDIGMMFRIASYIRRQKIDLIQSQLFLDNQVARVVGFLSRRKTITSVRGGPTLGWARTRIEHGFQRFSNRVVANSNWLKGVLVRDRVDPGKIAVIYNGIDPLRFQCSTNKSALKEKRGIQATARVIGIVGRLQPIKDHHTFIDVFKRVYDILPNTHAVLAGDGPLRGELEKYVKALGLDKQVSFLGSVGAELPEVLRIMDLCMLTSRTESLPNVLLEAMSAGVPIVATNVGGVSELVDDGVTGLLTEAGDVDKMTTCVLKLLTDEPKRVEFAKQGLRKVQEFGIDRMVLKYQDLYTRVLADQASNRQ